jgi:hypothetical protein
LCKNFPVFPFLVILWSAAGFAGGNASAVHVLELQILSETDYILVVSPIKQNEDVTRGCKRFEVHGTYARLDGAPWPLFWTEKAYGGKKETHIAALQYLKTFVGSKKTVYFGYMGQGFGRIDPKNSCLVESRGLDIIGDSVFSYFRVV